MQAENVVEIRGLSMRFSTPDGSFNAVDGADLDIPIGKTVCLVGESGSGKSVTARAILRLLAVNAQPGGTIHYRDDKSAVVDMTSLDPKGKAIRAIRGKDIGMIFQEPMSSLSPVHTIGSQMLEAVRLHLGLNGKAAKQCCIDMLSRVGIPRPEARYDSYAFQLSGGMRQRAMIAMALVCKPRVLIADEPTTALDVSIQAGILDLIRQMQQESGMAVLFITHDLGVVAQIADSVAVMYLGRVVEQASVYDIFEDPCHPYTRALLDSMPRAARERKTPISAIRGMIPNPMERPGGCTFHPRCDYAIAGVCDKSPPAFQSIGQGRAVRCALYAKPDRLAA